MTITIDGLRAHAREVAAEHEGDKLSPCPRCDDPYPCDVYQLAHATIALLETPLGDMQVFTHVGGHAVTMTTRGHEMTARCSCGWIERTSAVTPVTVGSHTNHGVRLAELVDKHYAAVRRHPTA